MKDLATPSRCRKAVALLVVLVLAVGFNLVRSRAAHADGGAAAAKMDTLFASSARAGATASPFTATFNSAAFHVPSVRTSSDSLVPPTPMGGVHVHVNVSARSGNTKLDVKLQQLDPLSGGWADEPGASLATITATGDTDLIVYPTGAASTNRRVLDAGFGQLAYRAVATLTSGGTTTFSASATYIP